METPALKTLTTIADTLVALGRYKDPAEAIKGLALEQIDRKITSYRRRIKHFESKYRMAFEEFTASLRGKATMAEEDEWFEWESAILMTKEWQKARTAITNVR